MLFSPRLALGTPQDGRGYVALLPTCISPRRQGLGSHRLFCFRAWRWGSLRLLGYVAQLPTCGAPTRQGLGSQYSFSPRDWRWGPQDNRGYVDCLPTPLDNKR